MLEYLYLPVLSALAIFGFSAVTDVAGIYIKVHNVPFVMEVYGYDEETIEASLMQKLYTIDTVAGTARGDRVAAKIDWQTRSLMSIGDTLGIRKGVVATQKFFGMIPYQVDIEVTQDGDTLHLGMEGLTEANDIFHIHVQRPVGEMDGLIKDAAIALVRSYLK